ncbi:MAG: VanZ family protein [Ornithinimicrobium sp.]
MGDTLAPGIAVVVVVIFFVMAMAVPFITTASREPVQAWRRVAVAASAAGYAAALVAYTILPLPAAAEMERRCADGAGAQAQWVPLHFVVDLGQEAGSGVVGLLFDPVLRQVLLNIVLFVPLGYGLRMLGSWSSPAIVAIALACSAVIEVSQGTGLWFIYDCAYRVMDVDDVLANTAGAATGLTLAIWVRAKLSR